MIKKRVMIIIVSCIVLIIFSLVVLPFFYNYMLYRENKKKVLDYMERQYDIEWKLVDTSMGKDAWPAGRTEDTFVFKDVSNDFYFVIDCINEYLHDEYLYAYEGKMVSNVVEENFPKDEYEYCIRCWGEKFQSEEEPYLSMWCQLFVMAESDEDLSKAYEIVSFMKDKFPGLELYLLIVPDSVEREITDLLEHRKVVAIREIKNFYYKELELEKSLFSSMEEFRQLLGN